MDKILTSLRQISKEYSGTMLKLKTNDYLASVGDRHKEPLLDCGWTYPPIWAIADVGTIEINVDVVSDRIDLKNLGTGQEWQIN